MDMFLSKTDTYHIQHTVSKTVARWYEKFTSGGAVKGEMGPCV